MTNAILLQLREKIRRRKVSDEIDRCTVMLHNNHNNQPTTDSLNKPVGDWISPPSPNFVAMATRVGPQDFAWFHWIGHPRKPPGRPKHLSAIQADL